MSIDVSFAAQSIEFDDISTEMAKLFAVGTSIERVMHVDDWLWDNTVSGKKTLNDLVISSEDPQSAIYYREMLPIGLWELARTMPREDEQVGVVLPSRITITRFADYRAATESEYQERLAKNNNVGVHAMIRNRAANALLFAAGIFNNTQNPELVAAIAILTPHDEVGEDLSEKDWMLRDEVLSQVSGSGRRDHIVGTALELVEHPHILGDVDQKLTQYVHSFLVNTDIPTIDRQ